MRIFLILFIFTLFSCNNPSDGTIESVQKVGDIYKPANYGNGVYYFECVDKIFAISLSDFLQKNPSIEVKAITGNGTSAQGNNTGFFVVVGKKT